MYPETATPDFRTLVIDQLRESPTNPRRSFDPIKLQELAQSIRSQGILVPLIVRELQPQLFEVLAGARRFRAAQLAELFAVPARIVELSDAEALELQLVENAIREDVHPYEEAMAYKALLESSQPRYDVATIALKTGRSQNHIYGRLRMAELVPAAAEAFQANQITVGHAVLIARLPQDQQPQALEAAFRKDWRSEDKYLISVRELSQWIRDSLMLTLADAAFDRDDADLLPAAGACTACPKRTGANTALFDDFVPQDDRCLDAPCFSSKIDAHIARQKNTVEGLVQITRAHYTNAKAEGPILTRSNYTIVPPPAQSSPDDRPPCASTAPAIVVEGPGKRGELVHVCADPECSLHGQPDLKAERERLDRERQALIARTEKERSRNLDHNRRLYEAVLAKLPKTLGPDDYRLIALALIDRFEYDDWQNVTDRYGLNTDNENEPDAPEMALREKVKKANADQLVHLLFEFVLISSGYSDSKLDLIDPLIMVANRLKVSLAPPSPKKNAKPKSSPTVKTPATKAPAKKTKTPKPTPAKLTKKVRSGGAA